MESKYSFSHKGWMPVDGNMGFGTFNPASLLEFSSENIGATQDDKKGFALLNPTLAKAATQQLSPGLILGGQGFCTTTPFHSQDVRFRMDVLPVQGSAPTGTFQLASSINGAAYSNLLTVTSAGVVAGTTIQSGQTISSGTNMYVGGAVTSYVYRTTNAGSDITAKFGLYSNGSTGHLTVAMGDTSLGGISFLGGNGTRSIARAGINITNLVNTAASESADLMFQTQAAGAAMATRLTIPSTGGLLPGTSDVGALGSTTLQWSDLFLAEGGVINWDNGDATLTQIADVLTLAGADLKVTTPGNVATSVLTTDGTQTVTNKTLTSPTINTSPVLGAAAHLKYTVPTADTTATGNTTNEFQTSYTTTLGDLVYMTTSGQWALVDANVSTGYDCLLGVVLQSGITSGNVVNVALPGSFVYMATAFPTWTIGKPIYISETAGAMTQTQPTTTDVAIRVVGYAVHADKMFFFPTGIDYITHT